MNEKTRIIEEWETVSFEALPKGWVNVFDCEERVECVACPGVLIQELRRTRHLTSEPGSGRQVEEHSPPFESRAVFADMDSGELFPANETSNYMETIAPDAPVPKPKGSS